MTVNPAPPRGRPPSFGNTMALLGGPGWEPADDWAALVAAAVIVVNGSLLLRTALRDLMDCAPESSMLTTVSQADPALSLHRAHLLSGMVKSAIRVRVPAALGVLIHMEPYEPEKML